MITISLTTKLILSNSQKKMCTVLVQSRNLLAVGDPILVEERAKKKRIKTK